MENLWKPVTLNNGIELPIQINNFEFLYIKKHKLETVISFHYSNDGHEYCIYKDHGFIGEEIQIPRFQIFGNIIKISPNKCKFNEITDNGLIARTKEIADRYRIKNIILGYSSISIKNYGYQPEQIATEFDEFEISGRFSRECSDMFRYKIDYETLCELIRNP